LEAAAVAAKENGAPPSVIERINIAKTAVRYIVERKRLLEETGTHKFTISVNELLRRISERANAVRSFGITVSIQELDKDVYTRVDATDVLRAFDKLLENATDAIQGTRQRLGGPPTVWIRPVYKSDQARKMPKATILFADNGPGFTPEQRRDFEKNKDIQSTKHAGLGRGLALARRCFADNAAYFRIVDPPLELTDRGAAFEIDLPLHAPRRLRALLVDDQDSWLSMARSMVASDASVEIETTTSYERILEAANGIVAAENAISEYDVILLDCHFSGLPYDGPELLALFHARLPQLARRVVLMSGKDTYLARTDVPVLNKFTDVLNQLPQVLQPRSKTRVFVSYSRSDEKYVGQAGLVGYLRGLEREGFEFWYDQKLVASDAWDAEIKRSVGDSDVALVLVSQAFLNSAYCSDVEVAAFLERRAKAGLVIFPVIVAPCDWKSHSWLASTQFEPRDGRTIETHYKDRGSRDQLYLRILQQLRVVGARLRASRARETAG
jgi:CheY-like chemotaxis protein